MQGKIRICVSVTTDPAAGEVFDERTLPAGSVVLSACRAVELEPEYFDNSSKKYFGLLSRFFDQMFDARLVRVAATA